MQNVREFLRQTPETSKTFHISQGDYFGLYTQIHTKGTRSFEVEKSKKSRHSVFHSNR